MQKKYQDGQQDGNKKNTREFHSNPLLVVTQFLRCSVQIEAGSGRDVYYIRNYAGHSGAS